MIGSKCGVALQTDEHIAKLTVQETMDFSAWVQGTELREGASPLLHLAQADSIDCYDGGLFNDPENCMLQV